MSKQKKYFIFFSIFLLFTTFIIFHFVFSLEENNEGVINMSPSQNTADKKNNNENQKEYLNYLSCKDCNIIVISLTNTRKDHLGIYGYGRDTSPNIDEFFKESIIFNQAFAPASWTLPVIASFFTSRFPYEHGVMDRYDSSKVLADEELTFAEILKSNNYKTAAFTGGGDHSLRFNFDQGFDIYREGEGGGLFHYKNIRQSLDPAVEWINANKDDKFFLLLQGYDTHCPFAPDENYKGKFDLSYSGDVDFSKCLWTFEKVKPVYKNGREYWPLKTWSEGGEFDDIELSDRDVGHMISLYDGEIAQADNALADFLEEIKYLGLEENTIIIFMSEHGDLFGEHGRFMRGGPLRGTFYDEVLNFPFLIKHPKVDKNISVNELVQTVDIMPTLLEMLNIKDPQIDLRQGKSVVSAISYGVDFNEYVYAALKFTPSNGNIFFSEISIIEAIRNKKWKLIKEELFGIDSNKKIDEFYELYNIEDDPRELNDLYNKNKDIAEKLESELEKWTENLNKK